MRLPVLTAQVWETDTSRLEKLARQHRRHPADIKLCDLLVREAKKVYPTDVPLKEYLRILELSGVEFPRRKIKRDTFKGFRKAVMQGCGMYQYVPDLRKQFPREIAVDILARASRFDPARFAKLAPDTSEYEYELDLLAKLLKINRAEVGTKDLARVAYNFDLVPTVKAGQIMLDEEFYPNVSPVEINGIKELKDDLKKLYPYREIFLKWDRYWKPSVEVKMDILAAYPDLGGDIDMIYNNEYLHRFFVFELPVEAQAAFRRLSEVVPHFEGFEWYFYIVNADRLDRVDAYASLRRNIGRYSTF